MYNVWTEIGTYSVWIDIHIHIDVYTLQTNIFYVYIYIYYDIIHIYIIHICRLIICIYIFVFLADPQAAALPRFAIAGKSSIFLNFQGSCPTTSEFSSVFVKLVLGSHFLLSPKLWAGTPYSRSHVQSQSCL